MTTIVLSSAAAANVAETGCDPADDINAILTGAHTAESLLEHCLDGADDDREDGWREYVTAVAAEAEKLARGISLLGARRLEDGRYVYRADETGTDWAVDAADVARVCDYIEPGARAMDNAAYTRWCDATTAQEIASGDEA